MSTKKTAGVFFIWARQDSNNTALRSRATNSPVGCLLVCGSWISRNVYQESCGCLFCSFVQFLAHLAANFFTPLVIDLRVNCKGGTGLCVSGFGCDGCHTDVWIGQQDPDEGMPEHMGMNFLDSSFLSYPIYQCAVAIRVDKKTIRSNSFTLSPTI